MHVFDWAIVGPAINNAKIQVTIKTLIQPTSDPNATLLFHNTSGLSASALRLQNNHTNEAAPNASS
jgi:hypothetical protein